MWPISEKFVNALSRSHVVASRVDLLIDNQIIDLTAAGIVVDGKVDVSATEVRRTMSCSLVDWNGDFLPFASSDPLAPAGGELRFWRGIDFQDGTNPELVPIGTFRFTAVDVPAPRINLQGYDRAWVVQGAKLETALTIAQGTDYVTAIINVLTTAYGPGLETNFPNTGIFGGDPEEELTAAMTFDAEADPWAIAQELASNIGQDLYFDPLGIATMTPVPDPNTTTPVWTFDESSVTNIGLPGIALSWDVTDAVNAVIIIGENSDNSQVFRGVAYDLDPNSPTQYGGAIGKRPLTIRDDKVTSQAQADSRALAELNRRIGLPQSLTVPSMVNPAFEVGDIAEVLSTRLGNTKQLSVFDKFGVPLRAKEATELGSALHVPGRRGPWRKPHVKTPMDIVTRQRVVTV